jgi:hypothetical protein
MAERASGGDARAERDVGTGPTYPPPQPPGLSPVLERNIRALQQRRRREQTEATAEERIADAITRFTGSMRFRAIARRKIILQISRWSFCHRTAPWWDPGWPCRKAGVRPP